MQTCLLSLLFSNVCHYRLLDKFNTLSKNSNIQICNNKNNFVRRAAKQELSSSWCILKDIQSCVLLVELHVCLSIENQLYSS